MKKIANKIAVLIVILVAGWSCNNDLNYSPGGTTAVSAFLIPQAGYYAELSSSSGSTLNFSWNPALAQDGQAPLYELVFFKTPDGAPVYRVNAGSKNSIDLTHKELNKAASAAGVETGGDGVVYWSVVSSRGASETMATPVPRKLSVKRLFGFNVIPEKLYLTGTASEGGDNIDNAVQFGKMSEEGTFEIYTKLTAGGKYDFVSDRTSGARKFAIAGDALEETSNLVTVTKTGIYRIRLDFNVRATSVNEITKVVYFYPPETAKNQEMVYAGNGVWTLMNYVIALRVEGWGIDERYLFRATVAGAPEEAWGSVNFNNGGSPGSWEGADYNIYIQPIVDSGYGYSFKLKDKDTMQGKTVDLLLNMSGEVDNHFHKFDNIR